MIATSQNSASLPNANPSARRALFILPNTTKPTEQNSTARMSSGVPAQVGEELIRCMSQHTHNSFTEISMLMISIFVSSAPIQDGEPHADGIPFVARRIKKLPRIKRKSMPFKNITCPRFHCFCSSSSLYALHLYLCFFQGNPTIPTPLSALAKANRTKRRLLLDSSRSRAAGYISVISFFI